MGTVNHGEQYIRNSGTLATLTIGYTNALSGSVVVDGGTLKITGDGTLGPNVPHVEVKGGILSLECNTAIDEATSVIFATAGNGVINLPTGVTVTVDSLWYDEKPRYAGSYGATGSGAQYIDTTRFSGTGILKVLHGNNGTLLLLR